MHDKNLKPARYRSVLERTTLVCNKVNLKVKKFYPNTHEFLTFSILLLINLNPNHK